jgi:hypothetical protein
LVFPDRENGRWIGRVFLKKMSILWQKDFKNLGSLGGGEFLIEIIQDFNRERVCRVNYGDL